MRYKVFGCKVNKYYTDKWLLSKYMADKNGIFIASCVVTDKAKKKWIKFVRQQLPLLQEGEKLYISGCGAFEKGAKSKQFFELYPELSPFEKKLELLPEDPDDFGNTSSKSTPKISLGQEKLSQLQSQLGIYTKKFVLIQGGCDSFCTFCLTVQKRGRHFFRDKEDILKEILDFERAGGKEVVLTGVNLSAWGLDSTNDVSKSRFAEILTYLLKNSDIARLRISSLGPEFIDDAVLKIFQNPRIYPHFHFSLQSGSSHVLKMMKRHYDGQYMRNLLGKIRRIQRKDGVSISLGADIIVGFPGETEEDFLETYDMVNEFQITKVHAFPFSPHKFGESVPAGFYKDQVPDNTKQDRLHRLLSLSEKVRSDFIHSQIGKTFEVLIESVKEGKWKGWTQNYIQVSDENFKVTLGEIKKNNIITGELVGVIAEKENDDFGL